MSTLTIPTKQFVEASIAARAQAHATLALAAATVAHESREDTEGGPEWPDVL